MESNNHYTFLLKLLNNKSLLLKYQVKQETLILLQCNKNIMYCLFFLIKSNFRILILFIMKIKLIGTHNFQKKIYMLAYIQYKQLF